MEHGETDPLASELSEVEQVLDRTLDEACAMRPASKARTDELIKADELLDAASEATKRAISLRRRRRVDREQPERSARAERAERSELAEPVTAGDAEAAASDFATHRFFADARGVQWDVFAVYPEAGIAVRAKLKGRYSEGWLSFNSETETRRLSPIPENWQSVSDEELARLAERAEVATRMGMRSRRRPGPEEPRQSE